MKVLAPQSLPGGKGMARVQRNAEPGPHIQPACGFLVGTEVGAVPREDDVQFVGQQL